MYKSLSEIYEQPVVSRSRSSSVSPFSSIAGGSRRTSVAISNHRRTSVASDKSRSISSKRRAQSVALLSSSTSSTRSHSPLESIVRNTKPTSFSYTRRSQSGNLLAVGPSNYKIIGFEKDDYSLLKSPLSRREGRSSSIPFSQSQSPYNVTALPFIDNKVPVQIASSSDESDNSPFIDEAAQLRSLVEETLALADTHFSPSGRGLTHGSTFPKYYNVILQDNSDTLSSVAQEIISLLATIHVGQNDEEIQQPSTIDSNHMALLESHEQSTLVSINPDSILPSVDVDDVLNDDEENYMRSRTIRLR